MNAIGGPSGDRNLRHIAASEQERKHIDGHRTMRLLWPRLARQLRHTMARGEPL